MEIPRSSLDRLTEELNALSGAGRQMVENALANAEWADVAELRAVMAEVMELVCGEMTDLAAARAAEFYDDVREASTGRRLGALAESGREPEATEGAVRALVQSVVETGAVERLSRELGDRVDYEVKRAAGECILGNGRRDPLKPRYARVPSGSETCPFCVMLASRGFVYLDSDTAGADSPDHYPPTCDCRIVPGFDTYEAGTSRRLSASTAVEGYEPDVLYDRYVQDLKSGRLNVGSVSRYSSHVLRWHSDSFASYADFVRFVDGASDIADLQQRCAVAAQEWGKTGLSDRYWSRLRQSVMNKRYAFEHAPGGDAARLRSDGPYVAEWLGEGASGIAKFETREVEPHEFNAYRVLMSHGRSFTVKAVDADARSRGKASPDLLMDGHRWELKCPDGANEKKTIGRNINKAVAQMMNADPPASSVRIIVSGMETSLSAENIEYHVKRKMAEGKIDEMIVIYSETDVRVYRK